MPHACSCCHDLEAANERRRRLAGRYQPAVRTADLEPPGAQANVRHVVPIHQQPGYCDRVQVDPAGLANTERLSRRIVSLPLYPELPDEQVERVIAALEQWDAEE